MRAIRNWIHHFLNPHCPHCKEEQDEARLQQKFSCNTCEVLKMELERTYTLNKILLEALTRKESEPTIAQTPEYKPILPRTVSWRVKQQMLESESKQAAAILKQREEEINSTNGRKPAIVIPNDPSISTEDLEKELDLVEQEREAEHG